MMKKKTLILGATSNPSRYSFLALNKLVSKDHPVVAIGNKKDKVGNVEIHNQQIPITDIDTITLYLNPANQKPYYDYILSLNPKRIIFNPGTENEELETLAKQKGVKTTQACTLVLLSTNQY